MSIKGGILDIFPNDSEYPVRIEFFGDRVESLRFFDPDTQLSIREIETIKICPAEEPEEGPDLIHLLEEGLMILNEPDEIKKKAYRTGAPPVRKGLYQLHYYASC